MASLLERMDVAPIDGSGSGPIRNRGGRAGSATPYARPNRGHSKADTDAVWQHDLYNGPGKTLSSRLSDASSSGAGLVRKVNASGAELALRKAVGLPSTSTGARGDLSIKGASQNANVIEVAGLVNGTTAADVEAIFKRCGPIVNSNIHGPKNGDTVTVRLTFKNSEDAKNAVQKFNGLSADGQILRVSIVGSANATLVGRLGVGVANGTVDDLIDDNTASGGSKMRSDTVLLTDPRAQVLVVPPGADPADYRTTPSGPRGRGGRRGGRGRRGGPAAKMDID